MRKGMNGLAALVQTTLDQDPLSGQVFIFRGRCGDMTKVLRFDGDGMCLFAKRLDRGRFIWPQSVHGWRSCSRASFETDMPSSQASAATLGLNSIGKLGRRPDFIDAIVATIVPTKILVGTTVAF